MTEYKLVVVGGKLQDISFVVGTTFFVIRILCAHTSEIAVRASYVLAVLTE